MLKSELIKNLINHLTERYPQITEKIAAESTQELVNHIVNTLVNGGHLEIRGFGTMRVQHRPTKMVRNPKTGNQVPSLERYRVHFKPAKKLRLRLNASYR